VAAAGGGAASSFERKSTRLVTPRVTATPNDMSAMSAWFSPLSAVAVVGVELKLLLSFSARMPNAVPMPTATTAAAPVIQAAVFPCDDSAGGGPTTTAGAGAGAG